METTDRKILDIIQSDFPVTVRPFARIAEMVKLDESDVLRRIERLKNEQIVREIGVIYNSSSIGYHSVLAAFAVREDRIDAVAETLNRDAGVSHNYQREGEYNIWFTLTRPGTADLYAAIETLADQTGVEDWLYLPTIRTFKIKFQLSMNSESPEAFRDVSDANNDRTDKAFDYDPRFIHTVQGDLPLTSTPFKSAAEELGWSEEQVVSEIERYKEAGAIRRIAAVLRPKKAGWSANVLVAWAPPQDLIEQLGTAAAQKKSISHCYQRPVHPNWPFAVYTMIHGRSMDECEKEIKDLVSSTGIDSYRKLVTVREFKKIRVRYYD